ncbi:DUF6443 domain-containing protein [Rufibacter quisquiliarum]|uniref:RHS repeat-associated protein n=1 Tax=Rufibacter quisquiliarum TaxID=1549639 RepID=A0A839GNI5_9BACT|nr:DUF6443 domain-containing protein [Rufibacter quisquiliarum]MBA9077105.1 RHS repeat-associated protein [Rufibacter quisquiliarum]
MLFSFPPTAIGALRQPGKTPWTPFWFLLATLLLLLPQVSQGQYLYGPSQVKAGETHTYTFTLPWDFMFIPAGLYSISGGGTAGAEHYNYSDPMWHSVEVLWTDPGVHSVYYYDVNTKQDYEFQVTVSYPSSPSTPGASQSSAIFIGSFGACSPAVSRQGNNIPQSGFGNYFAGQGNQPSDDVFYKFVVTAPTLVTLSTCGAGTSLNTYLHLLDQYGNTIASKDDNGPACPTTQASLRQQLSSGEYYAVVEGSGNSAGSFSLSISSAQAAFLTTSPDVSILPGAPAQLTASGADSYTWTSVSGFSATSASVTVTPTATTTYTVTGFKNGCPETKSITVSATRQLQENENYIVSYTLLKEGVIDTSLISRLPAKDALMKVDYFDGLGRPKQSVAVQASPSLMDIVTTTTYDAFGRPNRQYLPYTSLATGRLRPGAVSEQSAFYAPSNPDPLTPKDSAPYAVSVYEASPLGKLEKQGAPGGAWQPDGVKVKTSQDRTVKTREQANGSSEVRLWKFDHTTRTVSSTGFYGAGQLYVTQTRDEHGTMTLIYQDKQGQVVKKKVQESYAVADTANDDGFLVTHYIYDNVGDLRLVIQPEGYRSKLPAAVNGKITLTATFTGQWCFRYNYDGLRRLVEKQVPGAGPVETVYNRLDQPVLQRDALQAQRGRWSFTKFDALGRPVMTGELADTTGRAGMQARADAYPAQAGRENWEGPDLNCPAGFTLDRSFPAVQENDLLTITYYDRYDYQALSGKSFTPELGLQESDRNTRVRGQVTGSRVRVLGSRQWLTSVNFYDRDYRVIQSLADNHLGGNDRQTATYDFTDKPLETLATHVTSNKTVVTAGRMAYDHAGRLTEQWQGMDSDPEVLLARHRYNALGQLADKGLHSRDSLHFLQSVDFRYNIRGWLTHINNASLSDDGEHNDDANDRFGMELRYDRGLGMGLSAAQFNGNIAEAVWATGTDRAQRGYAYGYDRAGRLQGAEYRALEGTAWTGERLAGGQGRFSVTGLTYDANGNILGMRRNGMTNKGLTDPQTTPQYGQVDSLRYAYAGNRLRAVDDAAAAAGDAGDFRDGGGKNLGTAAWEYGYDANGNMVSDANKQIGHVRYNLLNLPDSVHMGPTKGYIKYTYTADGRKLRKEVHDATKSYIHVTDYAGGFVYERDTLRFAHTAEGRALHTPGKDHKWRYEYHLRDHLGSLRVSVAEAQTTTMAATMEPSQAGREEESFTQVAETRHLDRARAFSGSHAALLGPNGRRLGPTARVALQAGDSLRAVARAMYAKEEDGKSVLAQVAPVVIAGLGGAGTAAVTGDGAQPQAKKYAPYLGAGIAIAPLLRGGNKKGPKAFLVYSVYRRDSTLVTTGHRPVTEAAKGGWEELKIGYLAEEDGFAEVSVVSYEPMGLWFDDIEVTASEPELVQENHYDPWGLNLAGIERQGNPDHRFQYNGKEKQEELGLNWLDYGARMYDAQIGRFHTQDRFAEKYMDNTPYHYTLNNPIKYIDVNGDSVVVNGSEEFKKQYNLDRANLAQTKEGAAMLQFLEKDCNCLVVVSEASSILGSLKELVGMDGSTDHVLASGTNQKISGGIITLEYSQINGADIGGVESKSHFTLSHELRHAKDFADGTVAKDQKENNPSTVREKGERRAVETENRTRVAFGEKKIRTDYGSKRIIPAGATRKTYDTGERVKEIKRKR